MKHEMILRCLETGAKCTMSRDNVVELYEDAAEVLDYVRREVGTGTYDAVFRGCTAYSFFSPAPETLFTLSEHLHGEAITAVYFLTGVTLMNGSRVSSHAQPPPKDCVTCGGLGVREYQSIFSFSRPEQIECEACKGSGKATT